MARDYQGVLDQVVAEVRARPDVLGVLVGGSYATGELGPNSDLDLQIIVEGENHQRTARLIRGVQVECFFNPVPQVKRNFEQDQVGHKIKMFAQGKILYDPRGVVAELVQEAQARYAAGPRPLTEDEIAALRFGTQDALDDVRDSLSAGSPISQYLMMQLFDYTMTNYYRLRRRWKPKSKNILTELQANDRTLAVQLRRYLEEFAAQRRFLLLLEIVESVLEPVGGVSQEYSSTPESSS